ncbi:hypothetical protein [Nocardioides sp. zg-DK7169]|uniref:hypothetical protein n=1 Tax=Nocardioides sp. zg-DK7169 TaxID=2736600 RepID=UPI0015579580|nr:hypothetical protein [Nocardioides sp. zg-DK7169]NPC97707.1 hypothetical protein [Nocardioides sp. zg-DK7169]
MRRLLRPLSALAVAALLLAGCGDDTSTRGADSPSASLSSTPTGTPTATPDTGKPSDGTAMAPVWPPPGCREVSGAASGYAEDARGEASPEAAALAAVQDGVRAIRGSEPGGADKHTWYVVDAAGTGIAAVEVLRDASGTGWLASGVERCTDPAPR